MPGALALDSPEIAHWLQEQELEFDLTLIVADETDLDFAREAIAEADEVLFIAGGNDPGAVGARTARPGGAGAPQHCRLIFPERRNRPGQAMPPNGWSRAATAMRRRWTSPRPSPCSSWARPLRARGTPSPRRVPAFMRPRSWARCRLWRSRGCRPWRWRRPEAPFCRRAFWPAASLAPPTRFSRSWPIPSLWKRSSRPEAGLYDPVPLDNFLVGALQGLEIPTAARPFAAVSRSLSAGAAEVHRTGKLHGAVRAGIAPPGMLPPLILEGGDILASGENEAAGAACRGTKPFRLARAVRLRRDAAAWALADVLSRLDRRRSAPRRAGHRQARPRRYGYCRRPGQSAASPVRGRSSCRCRKVLRRWIGRNGTSCAASPTDGPCGSLRWTHAGNKANHRKLRPLLRHCERRAIRQLA